MRRKIICLAVLLAAVPLLAGAAADRRAETLAEGTALLAGVTLDASTPIATINGDPAAFEGKLVQVEGSVVALCDAMGCWTELADADDHRIRLKVEDGVVDLREHVAEARYVVAEGIFQNEGEHGSQVFIGGHGAVISSK